MIIRKLAFLPYFATSAFCTIYSMHIKTNDSQTYWRLVSENSDLGFESYSYQLQFGFAYLIKISSIFPILMPFLNIISVYYIIRKTFEFFSSRYLVHMISLIFILIPFFNITGYLGSAWRIQISLALLLLAISVRKKKPTSFLLIAISLSVHTGTIVFAMFYIFYLILISRSKLIYKFLTISGLLITSVIMLFAINALQTNSYSLNLMANVSEYYEMVITNRISHYYDYEREIELDYYLKLIVIFIFSFKTLVIEKNKFSEKNLIIILFLAFNALLFFATPAVATRIFNTIQYLFPLLLLRNLVVKSRARPLHI